MASTESLLQRLVLSASEIKYLTKWRDAMVEDYLNILRDLITLANSIDSGSQSIVVSTLFGRAEVNDVDLMPIFNQVTEANALPMFTVSQSPVDVLSVSANHTTAGDEIVIVTSNITVFLNPEPAELERVIIKRNTASGTVTVEGNGHTIDGAATYMQVINYESVTVIYIDTEWVII